MPLGPSGLASTLGGSRLASKRDRTQAWQNHEQRTRQGSAHGNRATLRGPLPLARRLLFLVVSALALGAFGTADLGRRERRVTHFGIGKSILPGGVKRNFWPFRILRVLLLPARGRVLVVEERGSGKTELHGMLDVVSARMAFHGRHPARTRHVRHLPVARNVGNENAGSRGAQDLSFPVLIFQFCLGFGRRPLAMD